MSGWQVEKGFKDEIKLVLTADEEDPELSPRCITRTLHLTLTFLCLTPNWVQMRTMFAAQKAEVCWVFLFVWATCRCPVALVLKSLRFSLFARWAPSCFSSALLSVKYRLGSSSTIRSPTHAAWTSFPRDRLFPHARQGMPVSSLLLRARPLVLRRWSRGCCSLLLHLEAGFRSSGRQSRADSHDTEAECDFFSPSLSLTLYRQLWTEQNRTSRHVVKNTQLAAQTTSRLILQQWWAPVLNWLSVYVYMTHLATLSLFCRWVSGLSLFFP